MNKEGRSNFVLPYILALSNSNYFQNHIKVKSKGLEEDIRKVRVAENNQTSRMHTSIPLQITKQSVSI